MPANKHDHAARAKTAAAAESSAAAWLARHDAGLNAGEQAEFARWLAADPLHAAAWRELDELWQALDTPREQGAADGMIRVLAERKHRRQRVRWTATVAGTAVAAMAAVVVMTAVWLEDSSPAGAPDGTGVALEADATGRVVLTQPERRVLPDGSVVELNAGAQIEVTYSPTLRGVRLRGGAAHFTVSKEAARPFVVSTESMEVRAVGTAFAVEAKARATDVIVTEGKVTVARALAGKPGLARGAVFAAAGQRVEVAAKESGGGGGGAGAGVVAGTGAGSAGGGERTVGLDGAEAGEVARGREDLVAEAVTAEQMARLLAWRAPRLTLTDTPLAEAVAAFNRHNRVQIVIADETLARLTLTGVLRADDAEGFVRLLETHYGVMAERSGGGRFVLRGR